MNKRETDRIERKIQTASEHAAPHQLDAILSACDEQKGTVIQMTNYTTAKKRRWLPAAAAAAAATSRFSPRDSMAARCSWVNCMDASAIPLGCFPFDYSACPEPCQPAVSEGKPRGFP